MKIYYFLLIFLSSTILLNAQQFNTQFYFTDTLLNKDTVTVGFDPLAQIGVDSIYGEIDLKEVPFGNDFEVRVGQLDHQDLGCFPYDPLSIHNIDNDQSGLVIIMGEKSIGGMSCDNGNLTGLNTFNATFFVKNTELPLKINWDNQAFMETCISSSFLTDWHPGLWFDASCGQNPFVEEISEIPELWINEPTNIQIVDRSGDTLSMIHLGWRSGLISSTETQNLPTFKTFPNPAQDHLTIQFSDAKNRPWELINVNGQVVQNGEVTTASETIEFQQLPVGVYFLRVDGFQMERVVMGIMNQ